MTKSQVPDQSDAACGGLRQILNVQWQSFIEEEPPCAALRRNHIGRLTALVRVNADPFTNALMDDFGTRSRTAWKFLDAYGMDAQLEHSGASLERWTKPTKMMRGIGRMLGDRAEVPPTPVGVGHFVKFTHNGAVVRNDYGAQMIPLSAPFGGVGHSGMGRLPRQGRLRQLQPLPHRCG
ncbi:hypothetical protein JF781_20710 [Mycobacterium sp. WUMAC-067]|uniref:hypothetical protein n=1 Tax=unclassified Mycobacterium TaxID=2642494 RepID=UPI001DFFBC3D|nr:MULTISPECIES: hypothetical protein [unclassified Mycobacterium]MCA2244782.1 hypothetical protein [Mycobacterium sp. WUMAC-067]MCA2315992.1 hypothetical protein [Mycobacterium sp. WUMAC-025]